MSKPSRGLRATVVGRPPPRGAAAGLTAETCLDFSQQKGKGDTGASRERIGGHPPMFGDKRGDGLDFFRSRKPNTGQDHGDSGVQN